MGALWREMVSVQTNSEAIDRSTAPTRQAKPDPSAIDQSIDRSTIHLDACLRGEQERPR